MNKVFKYTIPGQPISLVKVHETEEPRMWDSYRSDRFHYYNNLENQHCDQLSTGENCGPVHPEKITGPVNINATFYMRTGVKYKHKQIHATKPPMLMLYNFIDQALAKIICKNNCIISSIRLKKVYDKNPRTEITIKRL